jgi:hypothetical protein
MGKAFSKHGKKRHTHGILMWNSEGDSQEDLEVHRRIILR